MGVWIEGPRAPLISLKQIRYAVAIEAHGSFRKAAEACAISQSALSSAINEMEKLLGFQVFERDNKRVLVTPTGKRMLERARGVLRDVSDLERLAADYERPLAGPFGLGLIPTIAPFLLPQVLEPLRATYPDLQLSIDEDQSAALLDRVRDGELDAAVLALPYDCAGLLTFPFWEEDFHLTMHVDAAPGTGTISAEEIDPGDLMLLREGHCMKDHALSVCGMSETSILNLRGTSLGTLVQLVAGRIGTTLVPEIALDALVATNPALTSARLAEPGPHRTLAFVVRPNYPRLQDVEHMKALMQHELGRSSEPNVAMRAS